MENKTSSLKKLSLWQVTIIGCHFNLKFVVLLFIRKSDAIFEPKLPLDLNKHVYLENLELYQRYKYLILL
jgi:hypothetical protein